MAPEPATSTVPPAIRPDNAPRATTLDRRLLDSLPRRTLARGTATKADVYEVRHAGRRLVVKDFAGKPWWVRPFGRWLVARECRAYRALGDRPWLAPFLGRVGPHALVLEHVDGRHVFDVDEDDPLAPRWMASIERAVRELHEASVAHLDLRSRENVLLGAHGDVRVVDLASSIAPPHGLPGRRRLTRWLMRVDRTALLKWKQMLALGPLDADERARVERHARWRRLWIFNPKKHFPGDTW